MRNTYWDLVLLENRCQSGDKKTVGEGGIDAEEKYLPSAFCSTV